MAKKKTISNEINEKTIGGLIDDLTARGFAPGMLCIRCLKPGGKRVSNLFNGSPEFLSEVFRELEFEEASFHLEVFKNKVFAKVSFKLPFNTVSEGGWL